MPLITRRSSTRGLPRVSVGRCGSIFANCSSVSQKQSRFIAPSLESLNHETAKRAKPFMGPDQPLAAQQAAASADPSRINGHAVLAPKPTTAMGRKPLSRPAKPILSADESAVVRDRLQTEVAALRTAEDLVAWATSVLPTKNSLQAADAQAVEEAFEAKRRAFEAQEPPSDIAPIASEQPEGTSSDQASAIAEPPAVGFPKTRRRRDKAHLQYVASKPCLVCGRAPCDAHHLRFAEPRALGRKVSDEFTVPLCRTHHRQVHDRGDERAWWEEVRIDPQPIARQLWSDTRG